MDQQLLRDNITKLLQRVRLSAEKSQRSECDILVLAVSKTRTAEDIRMAHDCGLSQFGESYIQEALEKISALEDLDLTWHFIGPVQSNKTRALAEHFHWVHSVDRSKIATRLNAQRPPGMAPLQICIQVNISGEASKSGATVDKLPQLVREIITLPRLQLRGLMAIPAATTDLQQQKQAFARLRATLQQLKSIAPTMDTLSMGMSGDMEAAIAEGSTIIRPGTAIFGARNR